VLKIACIVLTLARVASADVANRDYLPFGERAAMLGNAGITSPYGEAVFYNPANLTRIDHPSLSVSGNTYLRYDLSAKPLIVLQGQDEPFTASGFVAIPSTVTSTYKVGDWWLATAVLVPEALDFKNRTTLNTTDLHVTILQQQTDQSLWLGASVAHKLGDTLSFGLSVFAARETESKISFLRLQLGDPATAVTEITNNEDTAVLNLQAVLGLYWEPTPALGIGLRVRSPAVRLTGATDLYASQVAAGTMNSFQEQSIDGAKASRPLPTDLGIGFAFRPTPGLELVGDFGLQLPATITTLDDPVAGTRTFDARLAPRIGVGLEYEVLTRKWIRLGALYNRSAVKTPQTEDDPTSDNYIGVTAGVSFQKERTVTSLGAFALQSNTEIFVQGADPPRRSDARVRLFGGMLSFAYRL
jgi:long-subunit fatty acid transport protein